MAEDAKRVVDEESAEQKGRANEETEKVIGDESVSDVEVTEDAEDETDEDVESVSETSDDDGNESAGDGDNDVDGVEDEVSSKTQDDIVVDDKKSSEDKAACDDCKCYDKTEDFQTEVRDQIENCKFEIISAIQESVHDELKTAYDRQVRQVERRRRAGFIVRDIIILLLAALVGYFGYCLYDAKYFDFLQPFCQQENNCPAGDDNNTEPETSEIVKDTAWYIASYSDLFKSLQINLNADKVSAYYLYSDDYNVDEIQPSYLLAMAYNRLNASTTYDSVNGIVVPAADMRKAFIDLYGDASDFVKQNFTYDCVDFKYEKSTDSFVAPSMQCVHNASRKIIENIDEAYEEGNVLYFLTTATIYDQSEQSFYTFDNLFKPVAKNVSEGDLAKHAALLNKYQYQFKKVDGKYYFSGITKLK